MTKPDKHQRSILPIPDVRKPELTTFDAKDPDSRFPPIEPVLPPAGAPNVLVILLDDVGFGSSSAFGGPCETPVAEKLAANGLKFTRFHTCALCSPTRQAMLTGRNHHSVGMGAITEIATARAGLQLAAPEHQGAAAAHPEAERVRDRPVRQVPRGAGLADLAHGAVRRLAGRRRGLRVLLRLHRRRDEPVRPGALRGPDAGRAAGHGRGGLPPHRGHDRPRHRLGAPAEGADAGEAVLRLLRAGRRPRPAPRAEGVGRQVQGPLRPGLGQAARGDLRAAEEAGRHRAGRRAHAAPRRDPGLGRHARAAQAGARAPDGGLCRVPGAHRPPHRPPDRRPRGPRRAGEHARLLHLRRQRRLGGRHAQRRLQRDGQLQRHGGPRDAGVHAVEDRRVRLARPRSTTTRWAGRGRRTRPTSGPSRWRRTGAARATARSCTGRRASRNAAGCATSSAT